MSVIDSIPALKAPSASSGSPHRSRPRATGWCVAILLGLMLVLLPGHEAKAQSTNFTQPELEQLLAPIALYPDDVLAQVLMASAYPAEVAQAADWLRRNPTFKDKGDAAVRAVDNQPWDPAVRSMVALPQVLEMMDANPDWTTQVGDAFITQRAETMSAVQALRLKAQLAGSLQSNERLTYSTQDRTILIQNPNPQVVYVPTYNPTVVYGPWPYVAYPPVYLPPPPGYYVGAALATGIAFGVGIAVTNAIWGGFDWGRNDVNININNFNNVHINNKQTYVRGNGKWDYDPSHRRDVPVSSRESRERVQKAAIDTRDRGDYAGFDRDRPSPARPGGGDARPGSRPDPQRPAGGGATARPATRPAVPDRGAFEGIDQPGRERPSIDRGQATATRPSPSARPAPSRPEPSARPAPVPRPSPSARPAPRPAPAARPAPRPAPAARPAGRPAPGGHASRPGGGGGAGRMAR